MGQERLNFTDGAKEQAYIEAAKNYVKENLDPNKLPVTLDDFFLHLLDRGVQTRERGNYGIAAAIVIFDRQQNQMTVVFGENSLMVDRSHRGHAEMNALENTWQAIQDPQQKQNLLEKGSIRQWDLNPAELTDLEKLFPERNQDKIKTAIITSLEPCIMCTGAIINTDAGLVLSAQEDDFAGALHPDRLARLPELWPTMVKNKGTEIAFCQSENPENKGYLSNELRTFLVSLFFDTKQPLDDFLAKESFLKPSNLLTQK